ncbi:transcription factor bHLH146 [Typha angustifolia]|uniref:transcription factor bHLH146 n=1 Tax=Typha angustifolia TaxID=59011 RepID=UPI003C2D2D6D
MKETQGNKLNDHLNLFQPNAGFLHEYLSYLLPALSRVTVINSRRLTQGKEIEKTVRFEVDMALVLSTSGQKWSSCLKHKLEQGMNPTKKPHDAHACQPTTTLSSISELSPFRPRLSRFPVSARATRPSRSSGRRIRREEELGDVVMSLRRMLPGGSEMALSELLAEVESYVVCLELQVNILKFLVEG